jgi:hypothetical protein
VDPQQPLALDDVGDSKSAQLADATAADPLGREPVLGRL